MPHSYAYAVSSEVSVLSCVVTPFQSPEGEKGDQEKRLAWPHVLVEIVKMELNTTFNLNKVNWPCITLKRQPTAVALLMGMVVVITGKVLLQASSLSWIFFEFSDPSMDIYIYFLFNIRSFMGLPFCILIKSAFGTVLEPITWCQTASECTRIGEWETLFSSPHLLPFEQLPKPASLGWGAKKFGVFFWITEHDQFNSMSEQCTCLQLFRAILPVWEMGTLATLVEYSLTVWSVIGGGSGKLLEVSLPISQLAPAAACPVLLHAGCSRGASAAVGPVTEAVL